MGPGAYEDLVGSGWRRLVARRDEEFAEFFSVRFDTARRESLAGWSVVEPASCSGAGRGAAADVAILPREVVEPAFVSRVAEGPVARAKLPLDSQQLADVATRIADLK